MPAVARLIIAAEPISSKLIIRNSSPKPSSRFSNRAVTASNVLSRGLMPVPPVVMMTCVADRRAAPHDGATCAGSSLTMACPLTVCPAALEQLANRAAAGVGGLGARVADGQDEAGDRVGRLRLVLNEGIAPSGPRQEPWA